MCLSKVDCLVKCFVQTAHVCLPESVRVRLVGRVSLESFTDDYTMGYTHEIGFRAGTFTPFYFYDINLEIQQPIRVHPFAVHDYALVNLKNQEEILDKVKSMYNRVKVVNGDFITIFSNELLGSPQKVDWKDLYKTILRNCNV